MPAFRNFRRSYPDIDVEIIPTYDKLDLGRRDADVAIRFDDRPPDHLVGIRLPQFRSGVYASHTYLAKHDLESAPELANWIGWRDGVEFPSWTQETPLKHIPARWGLADPALQVCAARAGLGVAMLPCFMGDLDDALVRVPGTGLADDPAGWILHHPELRTTERVRVLIRHLHDAIKSSSALVGGRQHKPPPAPGG